MSAARKIGTLGASLRQSVAIEPRPASAVASTRKWLRSLPAIVDEIARECCALVICCRRAIVREGERGKAACC